MSDDPLNPNNLSPTPRDQQNPTAFAPGAAPQQPMQQPGQAPFVHPAVSADPAAIAYQAGAAARAAQKVASQGGLKKYTQGLPGVGPAMPPLESPHVEGLTIAQNAAMHGASQQQAVQTAAAQPGSIVDGLAQGIAVGSMGQAPPGQPPQAQQPPTPAQLGIQNNDTLPKEAAQDPNYQQGQGAGMAMYQPNMALKYGVIRNGQHIPPQAIQANVGGAGRDGQIGNRPMSDTLADLKRLDSIQAPDGIPKTEAEAEAQAAAAPAAASQAAGAPPKEDEEGRLSSEELERIVSQMDNFDYDAMRQKVTQDNLNNPDQKNIIEDRLEELSLDELLLRDRVAQVVPVIPDKLVFTYLSMSAGDDANIKRLIAEKVEGVGNPGRYYLDKFSLMTLTAGITKINQTTAPSQFDAKGDWDDDMFWKKFDWMLKRPLHLIASIGTNHSWFESRVRKLFVAEKVKNG